MVGRRAVALIAGMGVALGTAPGHAQPPTAAATPAPAPAATPVLPASDATDWTKLPIDELRRRANAEESGAMEELAQRLMHGVGVPRDQQAGAGWLLRAARQGSAAAAFNAGVMYERGFVVERDPARAVEWYRQAAAAGLPLARHNLGLMLREGRGTARDGKAANDLLRAASKQGVAASMLALGDLYERGDGVPSDPAAALAWFAITVEFERQVLKGTGESALSKAASRRLDTLQRTLPPNELNRAREIGQTEFQQLVEALNPGAAPDRAAAAAIARAAPPAPFMAPSSADAAPGLLPPALPPLRKPVTAAAAEAAGWPAAPEDQVRVIQQMLVELRLMNDRPDGMLGPLTRSAIRSFERLAGLTESGEPTREVFMALRDARAANRRPPARAD